MAEPKRTRLTPEEAEAWRARITKQNQEFYANWVVIDIDPLIEAIEATFGPDEEVPDGSDARTDPEG